MKRLRSSRAGIVILADQAIVSGCNFFTMLAAGRFLEQSSFGRFSLVMLAAMFLSNLHRALMTQPMNVIGPAEPPERLYARLHAILRVHVALIPLALFSVLCVAFGVYADYDLLWGAVFYLFGYLLQDSIRRYWFTLGYSVKALANDAISCALQLIGLGWMIYLDRASGLWILMAIGGSSLVAFVVGVYGIPRPTVATHITVTALLRQHWQLGQWLVLTAFAVWGAGQVYPFLVASLGIGVVAEFAACRSVLNATGPLIQALGNHIPSRVSALMSLGDRSLVRAHFRTTSMIALVFSSAFLLVVIIFARELLVLFYGGKYEKAGLMLRIMAVGTVFSLLGSMFGAYSLALKDARASFVSNVFATIVTFTIGVILIFWVGAIGAAVGNVVSLMSAAVMQAFLLRVTWRKSGG